MNEFAIVRIISLVGFLVLAMSALNARRIGLRKGATMALAWAAIFVLVALVITAIDH
ncbi:hypothetical protein GRI58_06630 [Porphyrobacter algicida]|uniref:Uncharacterized protein n=1 Tax=Qipengyuania algicida TaxID=1836209 RepID=A0A845AI40_9SPHN|nr:hypothetical protein [Qipengyuania algicida]MXP28495.1 hypothetical protein [Qipengyuania algicida]